MSDHSAPVTTVDDGPDGSSTADPAPVRHEVDLSARLQHLVGVRTTVPADLAAGGRIVIATWTPGSYVERDYVHHLQSITAADAEGTPLRLAYDGRTAWRLPDDAAGPVTIDLEWYANELTVRTNHVDDEHALLVPPATFPLVAGAEDRPVLVTVTPTAGHAVWSLLPETSSTAGTTLDSAPDGDPSDEPDVSADDADTEAPVTFRADDQLHLVDSAFEVGAFRSIEFPAQGVPHRWVQASSGGPVDLGRIERDVRAIASAAVAVVGDELPVERYTFICVGADAATGGGGLEHRDGSVLMLPVLTDASDDGVARSRSLIAHEYFHLWNVKRLVPAELVELDLARPTHTTSLWVAEGWTAYYDDLLPARAGLTSARDLLDGLRDDLRWVERTPGTRRQSLVDSSWHAWTGLYVRDENSVNAGTSYYTHGAVVAAVLDLLIRRHDPGGDGLDEAFRLLWQRFGHPHASGYPATGYSHADVVAALSDAAGSDLGAVVAAHVEGTVPPPLAELLDVVGCEVVEVEPSTPRVDLGIQVTSEDRGPVIASALRDGPAWSAGVTGGDRLVAVDGTVIRRGDLKPMLAGLEPGHPVRLTVERAHRLLDLEVVPAPPLPELRIDPVEDPTDDQLDAFAAWSGHELDSVADARGD